MKDGALVEGVIASADDQVEYARQAVASLPETFRALETAQNPFPVEFSERLETLQAQTLERIERIQQQNHQK